MMYPQLPTIVTKVSGLLKLMREHYNVSPLVVIDEYADMKRMKVLSPLFPDLHTKQIAVITALQDFNFCYIAGGNQVTYTRLAGLYGGLDKALKNWSAELKKSIKQPEIASYAQIALEHIVSVNCFDMMKEDFASAEPIFNLRHTVNADSRPDFNTWGSVEVDWDQVKLAYNAAKVKL